MAWYLNRALTQFRSEVNSRWPRRDKTSDGTIGDSAHKSTSSDHNEDPDGSVDAWDMDVDGVDVWACIGAAVKHESIQYIIYNRQITSRSWGLGVWRPYTGSNPHDKHVHFNTREGFEASTKRWFPEEQMTLGDADLPTIKKGVHDTPIGRSGVTVGQVMDSLRFVPEKVGDLHTDLDAMANRLGEVTTRLSAVESAVNRPARVEVTVDGSEVAQALSADSGFLSRLAIAVAEEQARRMEQ